MGFSKSAGLKRECGPAMGRAALREVTWQTRAWPELAEQWQAAARAVAVAAACGLGTGAVIVTGGAAGGGAAPIRLFTQNALAHEGFSWSAPVNGPMILAGCFAGPPGQSGVKYHFFLLGFSSKQCGGCARPRSGVCVGSGARMVQVPHRSTLNAKEHLVRHCTRCS